MKPPCTSTIVGLSADTTCVAWGFAGWALGAPHAVSARAATHAAAPSVTAYLRAFLGFTMVSFEL